jgi:hypothetical protein
VSFSSPKKINNKKSRETSIHLKERRMKTVEGSSTKERWRLCKPIGRKEENTMELAFGGGNLRK